MKLPEYFTDKELACKCGCGLMPNGRAVELLYALRILMRFPITVNSGARCEAYNKTIPGSSDNSGHIIGKAFDIKVRNHKANEHSLIENAIKCGFTGIGLKDNTFLHVDIRWPKAVWGYNK